jgi:hypothetical protein
MARSHPQPQQPPPPPPPPQLTAQRLVFLGTLLFLALAVALLIGELIHISVRVHALRHGAAYLPTR